MADSQTRTTQQIEAEIAAARQRLAANVEGLINQVHPKAVVQRSIDDARTFAATEYANAKAQVVDRNGDLRLDRVGLLAGAVVGSITFVWLVRSILRG
ncbi:MAG: DUF3618 domain-containing protein [Micropruina sp.]|nr:MAG: DUF3618 domain-containing protein [Micropruina sp.]